MKAKRKVRVNPVISACREFYTRDNVSRITTGKKNTVTKCKVKMQKRLLSGTMLNLHRKFISECGLLISYSYFCKLQPFYIIEPTELDRQTCQCKLHENLMFMAEKLKQKQVIATSNLEELAVDIVCTADSKDCAYGNAWPVDIRDILLKPLKVTQLLCTSNGS